MGRCVIVLTQSPHLIKRQTGCLRNLLVGQKTEFDQIAGGLARGFLAASFVAE